MASCGLFPLKMADNPIKWRIIWVINYYLRKSSCYSTIEKDKDGIFIGTVPSLKGCYSYGKALDELMANLTKAIEHILRLLGQKKRRCLLPDSQVFKRSR